MTALPKQEINRGGRPSIPPEEELSETVRLRIRKADHQRLRKIAKATQKTGSELLRQAWLEYADKYLGSEVV
ncbi:hypothetical protein H6F95_31955 [Cyanobacteria bacterium FACHB-471]|nr:hypothetical protein [Cyanobacteria bacterium FACHB-471]